MSTSTTTPMILLRNAEVFAPEALGCQQLLLGGGRILAMSSGMIEPPRFVDVEIVDLQGLRVVPGLVDGHVHVTGGGGEGGFATRIAPLPLSRYTHS